MNQDSLKLNGARQLLVYVDGVMLGGSVHTIKRKTAGLAITNKENIKEVNAKKLSTWLCPETRMKMNSQRKD